MDQTAGTECRCEPDDETIDRVVEMAAIASATGAPFLTALCLAIAEHPPLIHAALRVLAGRVRHVATQLDLVLTTGEPLNTESPFGEILYGLIAAPSPEADEKLADYIAGQDEEGAYTFTVQSLKVLLTVAGWLVNVTVTAHGYDVGCTISKYIRCGGELEATTIPCAEPE